MKVFIYSFLVLTAFGCRYMPLATLPEDKPLIQDAEALNTKPILAQEFNNGLFENFDKSIMGWEISHPQSMSAEHKNGALKLELSEVGPAWEEFVREVPPLDFSEAKIILVRAKIDGWKVPLIRLDLIDKFGKTTNARPAYSKLAPRADYLEYVFRFEDAFIQNWPTKDIVDQKQITKLRFNINGGKSPYSGTIYFDEVKIVKQYP